MVVALRRQPIQTSHRVSPQARKAAASDQEATVACPKCKDIQTVLLHNGVLVRTRKFSQHDGSIYHDCGGSEPCKVLSKVLTLLPSRGN